MIMRPEVKCVTVSTGSAEALTQTPVILNIVTCLVLGRDMDFCASVFILYLCRQNVCKEVEVWHLFCFVVQNNLCSR